jgi:hypothetical protein
MSHRFLGGCLVLVGCTHGGSLCDSYADLPARYEAPEQPGIAPGPCGACGSLTLLLFEDERSGPVEETYLEDLASQLRGVYGLDVTVGSPLRLSPLAYDSDRGQYDGNELVREIERAGVPDDGAPSVIAVMYEDLFLSSRNDWRWAFGARAPRDEGGGLAVISAYRMAGPAAPRRMLVMLGRYIGDLACGFPPTNDPASIMFDRVMSARDLDRMNAVVCAPVAGK